MLFLVVSLTLTLTVLCLFDRLVSLRQEVENEHAATLAAREQVGERDVRIRKLDSEVESLKILVRVFSEL